ncbi:uncharacterized protein [Primulina eburnea]|uniref:uncharacterized protein n=1 Tax=Primulina eburnea TaxID=1245227 RepID=UPI003C6CAB11
MASIALFSTCSINQSAPRSAFSGPKLSAQCTPLRSSKRKPLTVVAAAGDVASDSTVYLFAGAAAVALIGTAFPILFSRKDLCTVCDGAGFVRKSGSTLKANAARKDEPQIVCPNCKGLGKLNQIDK